MYIYFIENSVLDCLQSGFARLKTNIFRNFNTTEIK